MKARYWQCWFLTMKCSAWHYNDRNIIIILSKPIKCPPRENCHINYGFWVIMMSQYRFINGSKCTTLGVGGLCKHEGRGIWEISVFLLWLFNFAENLKLFLKGKKKKLLKKKEREGERLKPNSQYLRVWCHQN